MSEKEFPKKYLKKLRDGWADGANSMSTDELKSVILECEGNMYKIQQSKDEDEKLNAAKAIVKDLAGPYAESKAAEVAKIQYCLWLMENRGVDLDKREE